MLYSGGVAATVVTIVFLVIFGLIVGSFFNVLIYRLPRDLSIVYPSSHCPHCKAPIAWYDNIPVLSFILLGAKCRRCGKPISIIYPLVEIGTALLFIVVCALCYAYNFSVAASILTLVFISILFVIFIIDLREQIIPHQLTVAGIIVGLAYGIFVPDAIPGGWIASVIGMFVLSLFIYVVVITTGGMGGGDIWMAAMMGAFLGWKMVIVAAMVSFCIGGAIAISILLYLIARRKYKPRVPIPFGPILAVGTFITIFWGGPLLAWYLSFFHMPK